jgi:hypothetical protein
MFLSRWHSFLNRHPQAPRSSRRPRGLHLRCEELEPRCQPSVFSFSTGNPDGLIATRAEPENAHNSNVEFETADDFVLPTETQLTQATFTGLLTGGATTADLSNANVEIYQVFPKGSNVTRTSGPPVFSTSKVPTRVNSPSDVALILRDSADSKLSFTTTVLSASFNVANSVTSASQIAVGGASTPAPTSGEEVQFNVTFTPPLDLPPDHYFFVPHVGLGPTAPAGSEFLWLSAARPIQSPGTPFAPDLQAWERNNPGLAPDWLRIGTDIVGGTTFNETFSLTGQTFPLQISDLSQNAAPEGSGDGALTVNGSNFTTFSTVLFNGLPLATTFVNAGQLQAVIPAAFLAHEGTANIVVTDAERGLSNAQTFTITENVPAVSATVTQSRNFQDVTLSGQVSDQAFEDHRVRIDWGDGNIGVFDLGAGPGGPFSASHHYKKSGPRQRTIKVTALDDQGTASAVLMFTIRVHK